MHDEQRARVAPIRERERVRAQSFRAAELPERVERGSERIERERGPRVGGGELLVRERPGECAEPGAPERFGELERGEPDLARPLERVQGEPVVALVVALARAELRFR